MFVQSNSYISMYKQSAWLLDRVFGCRWGLQLLYVSWLTPAPGTHAPATATFLSGLGFCGLDSSLLQALSGKNSGWGEGMSSGRV